MSGYNAYLSFANYMRQTLDGVMTVMIEKRDDEVVSYPYLIIQDGPDLIDSWISNRLIQGWVVVRQEDNRPLIETLNRAVDKVVQVSKDTGQLIKYDYSQDPIVQQGYINAVRLSEISAVMPSSKDPKVLRKIVTWELCSNNS
jgi:uncharacterized protein YaiI (UPF0178 family)